MTTQRNTGCNLGYALLARVAATRTSVAYVTARAAVVAAASKYRTASPDDLRAAGGWSAIVEAAIIAATAGCLEENLGLWGRGSLVAVALRAERQDLRLAAQGFER